MNEALSTYRKFWDRVVAGDFDKIRRELADPSFRFTLPGDPDLAFDGMLEAAQTWKRAFSDFGVRHDIDDDTLVASADGLRFAAVVIDRLTHDGVFLTPEGQEFKPTGNKVEFASNHIFVVSPDGKMLRWYIQFDYNTVTAQLL